MSCALLDLHIQIVQSNLVQSVADFHNRDLGFLALSPVFGDRPSCSSSFGFLSGRGQSSWSLRELKSHHLPLQAASVALAFVINWGLSSKVTFIEVSDKLKHAFGGFLSIF